MSSFETDCQTVQTKLSSGDNCLLLDCREQHEWDHVRIEGAELLPMSEIQARIGELDEHREREIIVYCHHGGRSLQIAMWLQQQGFSNALSMAGGIDAWAQNVDPDLPRY